MYRQVKEAKVSNEKKSPKTTFYFKNNSNIKIISWEKLFGYVRWYNNERGWGFIVPDIKIEEILGDLFFHKKSLIFPKPSKINSYQRVSFVVGTNGKTVMAMNVAMVEDK